MNTAMFVKRIAILWCCLWASLVVGAIYQAGLPASIQKADDDFHDTQWAFYNRVQATQSVPLALTIRVVGNDFKVGDPIPVEFTLTNTGTLDFAWANLPENLPGYDRRYSYSLTARDDGGRKVADPLGDGPPPAGPPPNNGLGRFPVLKSGESYSNTTYLNSWARVTTPGTYRITGAYNVDIFYQPGETPPKPLSVSSSPILVAVKIRSEKEMGDYIQRLSMQLAAGNAHSIDAYTILMRLAFTGNPAIVPAMLRFWYSIDKGQGGSEAYLVQPLLGFVPPSEGIWKEIIAVVNQNGVAEGMQTLLEQYDRTLHGADHREISAGFMFPIIMRSLMENNPVCWSAGAMAAEKYPNDAFVPRLIAIASLPGYSRESAIEALAQYRTNDTVRTLHLLLNDPDPAVRAMTVDRIEYAYRNRNASPDSSHTLRDDDFDASLRQRP